MPGWYIHMEAAKQAVDRLRAGDVPPDFPKMGFPSGADRAKQLGNIAYKWRNYLALGAIGPDIFYLLPDFTNPLFRNQLALFIDWFLKQWSNLDDKFLLRWDKYAKPAVRGVGAILDQMSGGLLREIGQAHQELAKDGMDLLLDLVAHLSDWFGYFGSGVPSGFSETEFYWSDMFHYRSTYTFARQLFQNASTEQLQAFALGWMTHCATDVTGHPFVNEKVGGPWRLHWTRHHVVENHMDAKVYDTQHHGVEPYGELDTSCLHFRLAFRHRNDGDYAGTDGKGFDDAPAYDYFAGFPPYNTSDTDQGDISRGTFFDLDSGDLSDDLCLLLIKTMKDVYGDLTATPADPPTAPQILRCTEAKLHDDDTGRPSPESLKNTFSVLYDYVKHISTTGYSPSMPPPPRFTDHSPPPFPKPNEDPARGSVSGEEPNALTLLFEVFAFLLWLGEFGVWLATLPELVVADLLTWPVREVLYLVAVNPLYSLYMAVRQPLVMSGFLHPKQGEISPGLVQLGVPSGEPSGRLSTTPPTAYGADPAYPRAVIEDQKTLIESFLNYAIKDLSCGQPNQPSEYLRPWRYPDSNNAGQQNGKERAVTHPGPWMQGQSAEVLMNTSPGDSVARSDFERAKGPEESENLCNEHFPAGRHLGDPVDYSVYLIGRLTNTDVPPPPDFNLDSDRGYGYHCWDWMRDNATISSQDNCTASSGNPVTFDFKQPCTVPEGFCNLKDPSRKYDPKSDLQIYYRDGGAKNPGCPQFR